MCGGVVRLGVVSSTYNGQCSSTTCNLRSLAYVKILCNGM